MEYGTTEGESGSTQDVLRGHAEQVSEKAKEVTGNVQDRVRDQVDTRSTQAGEQVGSLSEAMRNMGQQLQSQGNDMPAQLVHQVASRTEDLGRYLREADSDQILGDIEDFGRRQPWVMVAVGLAAGVAAARFVKASGRRRYEGSGRYGNAPKAALGSQSSGSSTYGTPAYESSYERTGAATPPSGGAMTAEETRASSYPTEPIEVTPSPTEQERGIYPPRGSE